MNKVPIFRFWCQHVLPLVYDNSLSYLETVCKVVDKLNEVIETLNSYSDELEQLINQRFQELQAELLKQLSDYQAKVNAQLDAMQDQMDGLEAKLTQQIAEFTAEIAAQIKTQNDKVTQQLADNKNYVDSTIAELRQDVTNEINANQAEIAAKITTLTNYVNAQVAVIHQIAAENLEIAKAYTDSELDKFRKELIPLTNVYVRDPTTGLISPLQTALDNIYEFLRQGALTAYEYDNLMLTAEQYDNKELTAYQYDMWGKEYLWSDTNKFMVFSGITGEYIHYKWAFRELYTLHRTDALTAGEYDALDITAEDYDNNKLTAYTYDWDGKNSLSS